MIYTNVPLNITDVSLLLGLLYEKLNDTSNPLTDYEVRVAKHIEALLEEAETDLFELSK